MLSDADCLHEGDGQLNNAHTDPEVAAFDVLTPAVLRGQRSSLKWTRFPDDVLPLFVAEMDFPIAEEIQQAVIKRVLASDTGYLDGPGELAPVFADYANANWGWQINPAHVYLATDVSCGIVEPLRLRVPTGGRVVITTPVYPSFFEMLEELPIEIVQVQLLETVSTGFNPPKVDARLDLAALEREFAATPGIDALVLCNPHNPHGVLHSSSDLRELARLAAKYNVFVISDEVHAPLTHRGHTFTPFAPIAAAAGALSVTATSASKSWNIAGLKCSMIVAADDRADQLLKSLPPEVACRTSILGLHANVAAYRDSSQWLERAMVQIEANVTLLGELLADRLPSVSFSRPAAGYLAWLDFRDAGLGPDPYQRILVEAKVALNDGAPFGLGGEGRLRINLACAPDTIRQAIDRIATLVTQIQTAQTTLSGAQS